MPGESVRVAELARYPVAPTSAAGFAEMFASIDSREWGGADVSLSIALPDGRSVWLFGDTFSAGPDGRGRFVHSTAIVQTGGVLHVSRGGAQVLPNDDATHIYWVDKGRLAGADKLLITARSIEITGTGVWDFRDAGFNRTALVRITPAGDLTFLRWLGKEYCQQPDPGPLYRFDSNPQHFGYSRRTHPQFALASGKTLVTTCQNWDDATLHPFADYRPRFAER